MKRMWAAGLVLMWLPVAGVPAQEPMPAGAVQRGTLANRQLIEDSKVGVAQHVAALGCTALGDVATYVTEMPSGEPGRRHWKELWVVSGCSQQFPVHLSFAEDATGATWSIP